MKVEQIVVTGKKQVPASTVDVSAEGAPPRVSFLIEKANRGLVDSHAVALAPGEMVELVFEDDTVWLCNAETLAEVFPQVHADTRTATGSFVLPVEIRGEGSERGILGSIALKIVNVFAKKAIQKGVLELAQELEKKQLEHYSGLYALDEKFAFQPLSSPSSGHVFLLFLHGTASSTVGSFGELRGSESWTHIRRTYGANVLAFQHETLSKSPLQNTLELIRQLPASCTLHVVSHSRGGLVGELLSRFATTDENNRGFDDQEIAYLAKTNRTGDLACIEQISAALKGKRIVVEKFVRVACPANGTILASNRMERFFNIAFNLLGYGTGLAVNPVYMAFKNLVGAVLASKDDVDVLPGLEAMNPDSAFIKVLNSPSTTIAVDSPLTVISGNCTLKPNLKALLIIASKLFYLKDNDLVVNTLSMYQGTKRTRPTQFYFDSSSEIDHFHYFKNARTVQSLAVALHTTGNAPLPGFHTWPLAGGLPTDRNAMLGLEGGKLFLNTVTGDKPIVLLLPGIMGSTLDTGSSPLWINYLRFIGGDLTELAMEASDIQATGIVRTAYKRLADYLSGAYDVVTFPFDWRLSLPDTAQRLNDKIRELLAFNKPLKVIAHSMGGVLMRDFILQHPTTWQQLNQSANFRWILLGTPMRGSFRIPAVLLGRDSIINKLSKVDIRHTKAELVSVFAQFPGLLGLLPLTTGPGEDFADRSTWEAMRTALGEPGWPLPAPEALAQFQAYRDQVLAASAGIDFSNAVYVAGQDPATPDGYRIVDGPGGRQSLEFVYTAEGDQSVTWATGIPPQLLQANAVYYVNITHGSLANEPRIFGALAELLSQGTTAALSRMRPQVRSWAPVTQPLRAEDFDLSPAGVEQTLLGLTAHEPASDEASLPPLRVRVSNGDLRYAAFPLLAGHFATDGILYAENVINKHLSGALSERHKLGIYPGDIGTSDVFTPPISDYAGAIIVGLGNFGELTAYQLTITVEQGVSKYLHGLASRQLQSDQPEAIGLSALLIGSGYGGLPVESSVRAIMQGVHNANAKLRKLLGERAPAASYLEFIEVYEDLAVSCLYAVKTIEQEANKSLSIAVDSTTIKTLFGLKKRLLSGTATGWWNRLTVQLSPSASLTDTVRHVRFSMSTGGAREEQRVLHSSVPILTQLLNDLSVHNRWSPPLAKTVFELLIPNDLKETLLRQSNINWILDEDTAAYPWELLQDSANAAKPLCVNAGMIRQLSTQEYRLKILPVAKETALVIGDPKLERFLPQLEGARKEAGAVADLLRAYGLSTTANVQGTAPDIIRDLFKQDYKIIHLAGHGVFLADQPEHSGMVIGHDLYLSTREITQMSTVPELVFVNCCFLGQIDGVAERYYQNRYRLAANIGTQLIRNGVKAVVVAGWAVDDAAALTFAQTFYGQMMDGCPFGEAVLAARRKVYEQSGEQHNTWGAYQCYGDPFYKLRNGTASAAKPTRSYVIAEEAELELINLFNEVESGRYETGEVLAQLEAISKGVDACGLRTSVITEHEAYIYLELYEYEYALAKFKALLEAEQASFSVSTLEKYCNLRAKYCVRRVADGAMSRTEALKEINGIVKHLGALLDINPTAERLSLLGSTFKRKAWLLNGDTDKPKKGAKDNVRDAYAAAAYHYQAACQISGNAYRVYSLTNWYILEALLALRGEPAWGSQRTSDEKAYSVPLLADVQHQLSQLSSTAASFASTKMDYWTMVEAAHIQLCLLFFDASRVDDPNTWVQLLALYRLIWGKAGSKAKRMAEVEHLEFLDQALQTAKGTHEGLLQQQAFVSRLHAELKRMVVK